MCEIEFTGALPGQAGGHGKIMQCYDKKSSTHCIAKPVDQREADAYNILQKTPLEPYVPRYFGIHNVDGKDWIVIEDLTYGFTSPCVADLKVGTRHYDFYSSQAKIDYLVGKQVGSTTNSHGVRVIGINLRKDKQDIYVQDKKQGLKNTAEQFVQSLHTLLPGNLKDIFHKRLTQIRDAFVEMQKQYPGFRIYASSILVTYDGDAKEYTENNVKIMLIDLAHFYIDITKEGADYNNHEFDDGVLLGLNHMVEFTK
ncbi:Inositol polyphosphate kinase family protein [Trichomonas vaginalis G3]|uniref:Kinase n=1 Tax=Trichomonas vaginalis (strain ATCC PRA-98 / G3) TaxID=412133 RepID=A2DA43_TRIV3|nr:inositol phosphate biosynthetic process [Trichomonas vaginalis G3]EAY22691.1 Inositol polyphosphate kinase family protein [Trichomonas vaginalis G3]KAI5525504.1 inositol phosphate biosynthetic process [Trichomonas vaginalis G3]|eukprot:XP_001583677.1 Inositol polyphosphate kinase family protein [Trichomonas vaginalis G3]